MGNTASLAACRKIYAIIERHATYVFAMSSANKFPSIYQTEATRSRWSIRTAVRSVNGLKVIVVRLMASAWRLTLTPPAIG
jgi:hypothetical protein